MKITKTFRASGGLIIIGLIVVFVYMIQNKFLNFFSGIGSFFTGSDKLESEKEIVNSKAFSTDEKYQTYQDKIKTKEQVAKDIVDLKNCEKPWYGDDKEDEALSILATYKTVSDSIWLARAFEGAYKRNFKQWLMSWLDKENDRKRLLVIMKSMK